MQLLPKPFYEYGLFTERIIREAAPITLSTMLILGSSSESKCFNTSLHLQTIYASKTHYIFKRETARSTVFPQAALSRKDISGK